MPSLKPGVGSASSSALSTFRRLPDTVRPSAHRLVSPVDINSSFISDGVSSGFSDHTSAAAPVTCGVAIDVPEYVA